MPNDRGRGPRNSKAPDGGSLALSEVLSAIAGEFTRAAAGHAASHGVWKQVYESDSILAGQEPARMRVVQARVTLPVGLAAIGPKKLQGGRLTVARIGMLIAGELAVVDRQALSARVFDAMCALGQLEIARPATHTALRRTIASASKVLRVPAGLDEARYRRLVSDERLRPATERELQVVFLTKDLARLPAEQIARFEIELGVDEEDSP